VSLFKDLPRLINDFPVMFVCGILYHPQKRLCEFGLIDDIRQIHAKFSTLVAFHAPKFTSQGILNNDHAPPRNRKAYIDSNAEGLKFWRTRDIYVTNM